LVLYGTGLRHRSSLSAVTVQVGSLALPTAYVGQPGPGWTASLAGSGVMNVAVKTLDTGAASNVVTVAFQ
jgi:hypothetical protein